MLRVGVLLKYMPTGLDFLKISFHTHLIAILKMFLFMQSGGEGGSLAVDFFTFSSSIADHLRSASLVMSHAGKHLIGWYLFSLCSCLFIILHWKMARLAYHFHFWPCLMYYLRNWVSFGRSLVQILLKKDTCHLDNFISLAF